MSNKLYIVIDVQNDFVSGSLGSEKAQEVTPKIADFLSKVKDKNSYNEKHKLVTSDEWDVRKWSQIPDWCPMLKNRGELNEY